jgi:hypothetical protein
MVHYGKRCQGTEEIWPTREDGGVERVASVTINPREIMRFSAPDAAEPSELREIAQHMESIAASVENTWDDAPLPPKLREALIALAYSTVEPPKGIARRYSAAIRGGLWYARIKLKGEQEAFFDYIIAQRRLTDAVLAAIERENPAYQKALSEALERAFSDVKQSKALTPEDTLEQLRELSDEALRELR